MRKIIAALQTSVDCFIEGPNREMDWAMAEDEETWRELDETLNSVDTFILGRRMYPEYEQYWLALLANPAGGTKNETAYARHADKIPHIVLSKTLDKVAWKTTRIVRNVEEIRKMKQQPGRDMLALGGATLISSLMNLGLIDEVRFDGQPPYIRWRKGTLQGCQEAACLEAHTSQAVEIRQNQLDLQYAILILDAMTAAGSKSKLADNHDYTITSSPTHCIEDLSYYVI